MELYGVWALSHPEVTSLTIVMSRPTRHFFSRCRARHYYASIFRPCRSSVAAHYSFPICATYHVSFLESIDCFVLVIKILPSVRWKLVNVHANITFLWMSSFCHSWSITSSHAREALHVCTYHYITASFLVPVLTWFVTELAVLHRILSHTCTAIPPVSTLQAKSWKTHYQYNNPLPGHTCQRY